ncbi:hypothetical protein KEF85_07810 [Methylomonas paludis]|uniref:KAP NTPase domain-containing protein n=1 Tax=Methylomonas paludis TaxID=1173101 RepID=A0A975MR26_9GAMM|nr:P-loop NTPase fold protein [Methylomonas paludis]QWF72340.1 hypothetical protein KEF85_07810 [Methylomonas paludis]
MTETTEQPAWHNDILDRAKYAQFLTDYIKSKQAACVININAPWGTGKTFFLENWRDYVKPHHPAIYFNAWENDYGDDPIIALLSCLNTQISAFLPAHTLIKQTDYYQKSVTVVKKLAPALIKSALAKAIGADGFKALENINTEDEATILDVSSKLAEEMLATQESKANAISEFKSAVTKLIDNIESDKTYQKPLFIFIDELDRCRPLYSINLLETIKHIFNVSGTVFVVATDTEQLSHSVRAIYGEGFNAEMYIRRFFDQIYTLPKPDNVSFSIKLFEKYTSKSKFFFYRINPSGYLNSSRDQTIIEQEKNKNTFICEPCTNQEFILFFALFAADFNLDLRTQKQCFERFLAIESSFKDNEEVHFCYLMFLIILDAKQPTQFQYVFSSLKDLRKIHFLENLNASKNNIKINGVLYTSKELFEIYHDKILLSQTELRSYLYSISSSQENDFETVLTNSLLDNLTSINQYRHKVEMACALS